MRRKLIVIAILLITVFGMIACDTDASVASRNLSKSADQFEIYRRVVFYNGITDAYMLVVEGYCSIEILTDTLKLTVKTEDGQYLKHYLGLSDNVTYFVEQIEPEKVSSSRYRVIFKPSIILPDINIK